MRRDLDPLSNQLFDIAIIGGGIHGATTAREAALRGLRVALLESRDFASGTSSRSSKLIHGGLRYLKQLDFKLVHEARRERRLLRELAPHLARPVPFVLPIYRGDPYSPLGIRIGLAIYDLSGNLGREDRYQMLSPDDALALLPGLRREGLRAAARYHDSETDDARLTLENVLDAAEHGAVVVNYTEVRALSVSAPGGARGRSVLAAEAQDVLAGKRYEISARFWVNASGPWVDHVRSLLPGFDGSKTVRLTKGTHLIIPPVMGRYALLAAVVPGDRIFLMTPWHQHALLGTTDTDFEDEPESVRPDRADADYLLLAANRVLRQPLAWADVVGAFAGLRALVDEPGRTPSANTREYRLHRDRWAKNFVSICGGKLTTARALGEKLVEQILVELGTGPPRTSRDRPSRRVPLPGGNTGPFDGFVKSAVGQAVQEFGLPTSVAERIVRTYGSRWRSVLEPIRGDKRLAEPLPGSPRLLRAEVDFAIRHEMAMNVEDFLLRRSGLNWLASATLGEAAPVVAQIFAARFGWSRQRQQAAVDAFACMGGVSGP
jgi:glycerol-3-phosphate dehydrogenase